MKRTLKLTALLSIVGMSCLQGMEAPVTADVTPVEVTEVTAPVVATPIAAGVTPVEVVEVMAPVTPVAQEAAVVAAPIIPFTAQEIADAIIAAEDKAKADYAQTHSLSAYSTWALSGMGAAAASTGKGIKSAAIATGKGLKTAAIATGNGIKTAAIATGNGIKTAATVTGNGIKTAATVTGNGIASGACYTTAGMLSPKAHTKQFATKWGVVATAVVLGGVCYKFYSKLNFRKQASKPVEAEQASEITPASN